MNFHLKHAYFWSNQRQFKLQFDFNKFATPCFPSLSLPISKQNGSKFKATISSMTPSLSLSLSHPHSLLFNFFAQPDSPESQLPMLLLLLCRRWQRRRCVGGVGDGSNLWRHRAVNQRLHIVFEIVQKDNIVDGNNTMIAHGEVQVPKRSVKEAAKRWDHQLSVLRR